MKKTKTELLAKLETRYATLVAIQNYALRTDRTAWFASPEYQELFKVKDALERAETPIGDR